MALSITSINRIVRQIGLADESQFFIQVDQFADETFIVESISAEHWTIAEIGYQLKVKVLVRDVIDIQALLNKKAVVSLLWRGAMAPIVGEINSIMEANGNGDFDGYWLTLRSPLAVLKERSENRVFLDRSSLSIAQELLSEFANGRFAVKVLANEPLERGMTVQYQESDWDFLNRILLRDGIMVHLYQQNESVEVLLFDDIASLPLASAPVELAFRSARGAAADEEFISLIRKNWQSTPETIQVTDFQANSSSDVFAKAGTGQMSGYQDYRWADNSQTNEQAKQLAEHISKAHQAKQNTVFLQTNCRGLRPGMALTITGHPHWNGEYIIVETESNGQQFSASNAGAGTQNKAFSCNVLVVPAGQQYLPLPPGQKLVTSTITATIAAEVDASGYYQVRLPFDNQSGAEHTSIPTRMVQPFGGHDHGMHFPLTQGTEVLIGFENGDIDRPVILGAVHNDESPSVVTNANAYQNLIRTRGQHEFLMDDTPGEERIQLNTSEAKNRLQLNATTDAHLAELHSEEGDLHFYAGKNINIESGVDMNVTVGGDQEITVNGDFKAMTEEGDMVHQAGANLQLTASDNLEWVAEDGNLQVEVGGEFIVEAAEGCSTHIVEGDYQVIVENDSFALEAGADITFSAGNAITLTQGSGTFAIDSSGNLTLEGSSVEITANKIAIKGGTVGNN